MSQQAENDKTQSDKFKELAREVDADESAKRWDERLKKLAKAKPRSNDNP